MSSDNRVTKHSDAFDLLSRWVATLAQAPELPFEAVVEIHRKIEAGDIAGAQHRILQEVGRQQQQHAAQQDAEPIAQPPYDPNRGWHQEYLAMWKRAEALIVENVKLRQEVARLRDRLRVTELTPERIYDLGSEELLAVLRRMQTSEGVILEELRSRQVEMPKTEQ